MLEEKGISLGRMIGAPTSISQAGRCLMASHSSNNFYHNFNLYIIFIYIYEDCKNLEILYGIYLILSIF